MSNPWLKFYPSDWRSDPALRMCSLSARGLWMEMLCVMHEADPCGSLVINGRALTPRQIASLSGSTLVEVEAAISELEEAGVFGREPDGTIYSRRMRRDVEKAERDRVNGKGGGNPNLLPSKSKGVNPPLKSNPKPDVKGEDKAQKPEARSQKLDIPPSPSITAAKDGGGEGLIELWEKFERGFPWGKLMSRGKAFDLFVRLPPDDQQSAVAALPDFIASAKTAKLSNPIAAATYIERRLFANFAVQSTGPPLVFVPVDSPDWPERVRAGHKPGLRTQHVVAGHSVEGWHFPAPTPPKNGLQ